MPARQNRPATAEVLLRDLSSQMEKYLNFLRIDLAPAILEPTPDRAYSMIDSIATGEDSRSWIIRLRTMLWWASLASAEEEWQHLHGVERPHPGSNLRGVWSMPSFLRHIGQSKDPNVSHAIQQGRKLRRFERQLGTGISLLLVAVLPTFRRLSLKEETRTIQLLRTTTHTHLIHVAQIVSPLYSQYLDLHEYRTV